MLRTSGQRGPDSCTVRGGGPGFPLPLEILMLASGLCGCSGVGWWGIYACTPEMLRKVKALPSKVWIPLEEMSHPTRAEPP